MRRPFLSVASSVIAVASLIETNTAEAQYLQPLRVQNENPLIRIFNIPAQDIANTLDPGSTSLYVTAGVSNYFTAREVESEFARLDGETQRISFKIARGFGYRMEAGIEASWLNRDGGFLDGVIDKWHETFSLPRLGRDRVDNGLLDVRYSQQDTDLVRLDKSGSGIGDVVLYAGKQLTKQALEAAPGPGVTLRAQISIPTGDAEQLRSSGGVNAATWLQATQRFADRWSIYGNAGLSWLGPGDVLPEKQRHWMVFGGVGLGWQATEEFSLKIQLDGQSSAYEETALEQLGSYAAQLSFGGSYNFNRKLMLDIGVTENVIRTEVSPDLSFNITARSIF